MSRPTKYDVMRRNRRVLEKAAERLEADAAWAKARERLLAEREERGQTTADWVLDTKEQAREQVKPEPEPGTVRVLLHMLRSLPRVVLSRGA